MSVGDVKEQILYAAAACFAESGFKAATTRAIAKRVGLQQPSLFYYFGTKQAMFQELIERIVNRGLAVLREVEALDANAAAKFYVLVFCDVLNISRDNGLPGRLTLLPEARLPQFNTYWDRNAELFTGYTRLIQMAHNEGFFRQTDFRLFARIAYGTVEGAALWGDTDSDHSREQVAKAVSESILRALLTDLSQLEHVMDVGAGLVQQVLVRIDSLDGVASQG